jgi:glycosyltransferase involved in cell wall biosynthesis
LTGYLENFRKCLLKTNIFVAPIYFGTGIKTKILDAMALGMPVITTPLGVEGLKVKHFKNIIIAHNNKEFINFIDILLRDKTLRKSIGKEAYHYVNKFHNYDKIRKKFLQILSITYTGGNG